jgi:hypothetical protein
VLDFRQLPCFSGSCDNWMFANVVHNTTRRQWDDTHCNEMAQKFGCHPCKSAAASATYSGFGTVIDPRRGAGRVTLCPSGSPAPGQRETARGGLTYQAIGLLPYAESLRMSRLPCWSGSCDDAGTTTTRRRARCTALISCSALSHAHVRCVCCR